MAVAAYKSILADVIDRRPSGTRQRLAAALASETPAMPDLSDWNAVRGQFSLDPAWMHFSSFFIASHPAPVRDAIEGWRKAIDRDPFQVIEHGLFGDEAHNIPLQVRPHEQQGRASVSAQSAVVPSD